jgi:hypothetical protein
MSLHYRYVHGGDWAVVRRINGMKSRQKREVSELEARIDDRQSEAKVVLERASRCKIISLSVRCALCSFSL